MCDNFPNFRISHSVCLLLPSPAVMRLQFLGFPPFCQICCRRLRRQGAKVLAICRFFDGRGRLAHADRRRADQDDPITYMFAIILMQHFWLGRSMCSFPFCEAVRSHALASVDPGWLALRGILCRLERPWFLGSFGYRPRRFIRFLET